MFLTEYNEEKIMEKEHQEGVKKGTNQERERVAVDLLKEGGMSVSFISRISKLSEESVRNLAKSLGIAVF
jgi:predicted HTH domain antitoxin